MYAKPKERFDWPKRGGNERSDWPGGGEKERVKVGSGEKEGRVKRERDSGTKATVRPIKYPKRFIPHVIALLCSLFFI